METATKQRRPLVQDVTLKEKLKAHYDQGQFRPRPESASKIGLTVTACQNVIQLLEALAVLLPRVYAVGVGWCGEGRWCMLALVLFCWAEFTWNWWRVYYDVPNWVTKTSRQVHHGQGLDTPQGWRHCPKCQLDAPPRSHHCAHCNHCILKRDHHCFFTGSCVGLYNQRHFVVFCMYGLVSCVVSIYLQLQYLNHALPLAENFASYFFPVSMFHCFVGKLSFSSLVLILHVYLNIFFMCIIMCFLLWQFLIILRGQTSYEAWKMIRAYDAGVYQNIVSVFGSPSRAWVLLFAPLLLPLEADGLKWNVKSKTR